MTDLERKQSQLIYDLRADRDKFKCEIKRLRESLETIRWNTFATNPQAMIMRDIARKALDGVTE